jgi:hypothetical protein
VNFNRSTGLLLLAALLSAAAAQADVKGVTNVPTFTAEEIELINRDTRLMNATKICAARLRRALDLLEEAKGGTGAHTPAGPVLCAAPEEDGGRASGEGPFDLLQILKEAAGQQTKRSIEIGR